MLRTLFSRRWWWTTLLAIAAVAVLARLGIWQLDRLEQRRTFNAHIIAQFEADELVLTGTDDPENMDEMEYRAVVVRGEYDFENQVALRNQIWNSIPGVNLITPLKITGSDSYVLVNRGWIPIDQSDVENWPQFSKPGEVEILGMIRVSETSPQFGRQNDPEPPPGEKLLVWNLVNVERIGAQMPYELLPIYVLAGPDPSLPEVLNEWPMDALPFGHLPEFELTEGPHLGYAIQWFIFAIILFVGYPIFVTRESQAEKKSG